MSQYQSFSIPVLRTCSWEKFLRVFFPTLSFFIRMALGIVFLRSSFAKLLQPFDFLSSIYNYELVGPQFGLLIAMAVPWLELAIGICLVLGVLDRGSWLLAIALLTVFTAAQGVVAHRGLLIPCGCATAPIETVSFRSVLTTGLLLVVALAGFSCSLVKQRLRGK